MFGRRLAQRNVLTIGCSRIPQKWIQSAEGNSVTNADDDHIVEQRPLQFLGSPSVCSGVALAEIAHPVRLFNSRFERVGLDWSCAIPCSDDHGLIAYLSSRRCWRSN